MHRANGRKKGWRRTPKVSVSSSRDHSEGACRAAKGMVRVGAGLRKGDVSGRKSWMLKAVRAMAMAGVQVGSGVDVALTIVLQRWS